MFLWSALLHLPILLWKSSLPTGVFPQPCLPRLWISVSSPVLFYSLLLAFYHFPHCTLLFGLYFFFIFLLLSLLFTPLPLFVSCTTAWYLHWQDRNLAGLRKEAYRVCFPLLASVGLLSDLGVLNYFLHISLQVMSESSFFLACVWSVPPTSAYMQWFSFQLVCCHISVLYTWRTTGHELGENRYRIQVCYAVRKKL